VTADAITIAWQDNSHNEAAFIIEVQAEGNVLANQEVAAGTTSWSDTNLVSGTARSYRVLARNGAGNSAWSDTVIGTTANGVQPAEDSGGGGCGLGAGLAVLFPFLLFALRLRSRFRR
jgi:hypothetical protein